MVAPIALIPLIKVILFKKIAFYVLVQQYGYHRLYRRLLEGMRVLQIPKTNQRVIQRHLKDAIRFPTTAHHILTDKLTREYLIQYFDSFDLLTKHINHGPVPEIMHNIKEILNYKIPMVGRIIEILKKK